MFCDQCEQTFRGTGCVNGVGTCGKNEDVESLQKILLYGLKGMAAYKHHARRLDKIDEACDAFEEEALFATLTNVNFDPASLLELILECGRQNLRVMEMLNKGHLERLGKPAPAEVFEGTKDGPGILVTGHDMLDLEHLLEQTAGSEVNVYTHGEMLPAHMYPRLRQSKSLAGHWGGAWQVQRDEFEAFGGAILATTNCVLIPREDNTYLPRLFTTRATGLPGAQRIKGHDFRPLIEAARAAGPLPERANGRSMTGFHYTTLLELAPKIIEAVKSGQVRRFFLIGGCDGADPGRNYYAEFAQNAPADTIILTLGCGKYRIRDYDYGTVAGLPRLLDMGQCNDSYGAIQVALALAGVFNCSVNDLPLTLVLSWFEQKAVAVLLTLLALGVKGIRIGPSAPAFVTPNVMKALQDNFDLRLIGTDAKADLKAILDSKE